MRKTMLASLLCCSVLAAPVLAQEPSGEISLAYVHAGGGNYDPHVAGLFPGVGMYLDPLFDTLVLAAPDGGIHPQLVQSWEATGDALILRLQEGATFHDGSPVDAEAVKANLERAKALPTSTVQDQLALITGIEITDPLTVRLTLAGPAGRLLPILGGPAGMMMSPKGFEASDIATRPVGSGPWMVSDQSVPGKEMVYTAFPGYWNKSVQKVGIIRIKALATPAQVAGLRSGAVDAVMLQANPHDAEQLRATGFIDADPSGIQFLNTIYLNKSGVLANEHARRALSFAIDRELLSETVLDGMCEPASQAFAKESWAHDPDAPVTPYDEARVSEELKLAGMPDGFEVTAMVSGAGGLLDKIATAVQGMAAPFGIKVNVRVIPGPQLVQAYANGEEEGWTTAILGAPDPSIVATRLISGGVNPGGYEDAEMAAALKQANAASDPEERKKAMRAWSKRYQDVAFHMSICNQTIPLAVNKRAHGVKAIDPLTITVRGASVD